MKNVTHISYAEFREWCNERCCDGLWNMRNAIAAIAILQVMRKAWFWKRRRLWRDYEPIALRLIASTEGATS